MIYFHLIQRDIISVDLRASDDWINNHETGVDRKLNGEKLRTNFQYENLKEIDHLEDLGVNECIILKLIFTK
jgi:hypothetical protein